MSQSLLKIFRHRFFYFFFFFFVGPFVLCFYDNDKLCPKSIDRSPATNTYAKGSIVFGFFDGDCFYVIVMMRYLFEGFVSSGRYIVRPVSSSGAGYRCAGREWT